MANVATRPYLPLNALRAFEASARHLSFTRAAGELCVTQAAISHQVKALEQRLGAPLFRRLPRGLAITDEGLALLPVLTDAFDRMGELLDRFENGQMRQALTIGAVSAFAVGWLLPRLAGFQERHPFVDLRLLTNNNKVDLAAEGLDYAIRYGDGAWHQTEAEKLFDVALAPLCAPHLAAGLTGPADLARRTLLRSYRADEWPAWFSAAGVVPPPIRGPVFDTSLAMVQAAIQGVGVALAPPALFDDDLRGERLVRPFAATVSTGAYWLTRLKARAPTEAMAAFRIWLLQQAAA